MSAARRSIYCRLLLIPLLGPGCGGEPAAPDLGGTDGAGPRVDQASPADLAAADLGMSLDLAPLLDLAPPVDLAPPADLAVPLDLAIPLDLTIPPDLSPRVDLAIPPDLAPPVDLTPPPDLVTPPDLTPTCADGLKNNTETDVDCGGPGACQRCPAGKGCMGNGDCATEYCGNGKCAVPDCMDGVKNGTESDIDCGGACPACAPGKKCNANLDCAPHLCTAMVCKVAVSCAEHLAAGNKGSGLYTIQPPKAINPLSVYCEQVKAGGGWALVFQVHDVTGLSENKFIAATGNNRFTDVTWEFAGGVFKVAANARPPQPLLVNGALDVGLFSGGWSDLRMACSKKNTDATEEAFGLVTGFVAANGNGKLLGAAANGKSYAVDKAQNSQGNSTIWVDNEVDGINSGHYLCDYTGGSAVNGTTQFSLCYTDFLNNDNAKDQGDSIVAIGFGTERGDDGWSPGFTFECGPMGATALQNTGTFSIWIR